MCFTIPRTQLRAKKASKDIVCYKALFAITTKSYRSWHFGFEYIKGKLYQNEEFLLRRVAYDKAKGRGQGFHSFISKNRIYDGFYGRTVKCIIPAGSYYFSNRRKGEYFSNQIIVDPKESK